MSDKPVFFDPTRRRAAWLTRITLLVAALLCALSVVFWASVLAVPVAHRIRLNRPAFVPDNPNRTGNTNRGRNNGEAVNRTVPVPRLKPSRYGDTKAVLGKGSAIVGGFYVDWDQASLESLRQHASEMTHLFPGWLHLNAQGNDVIVRDSDPTDIAARAVIHKNGMAVVPLVNNYSDTIRDFDETRLHSLLTDKSRQQKLIAALLNYVQKNHYQGILLDFETERDDDRAALALFTQEVATLFHKDGLLVSACTQSGEPDQAAAIAQPCDFIVPMLYDLHFASGTAGPIAPQSWVEAQLSGLLTKIPADKIVLAVGNYAYNWQRGKSEAQTLTFGEAMLTAQESRGDGKEGVLQWDKASQNPYYTYFEDDGKQHDVWLMDAATAWNVQQFARAKGVQGRALWYVGSEDPTLWSFFGKNRPLTDIAALEAVRYGFEIDFEGEGELLDVAALPQPGKRILKTDAKNHIVGQHWVAYPTACVIRRSGKTPKTIALTFDDGPDAQWTPPILDALKIAGVPATFFVIGANVEAHAGLTKRIWDQGNDIGNHSFYHPNLSQVGETRAKLEIDATQRAIQATTGRSTTLFRPPYGVDTQPETASEAEPIELAQRLGYLTVAEGLDPRDWEGGAKKKDAEQIADSIVRDAEAGLGNIVLLHDSGGDRTETVKAIPLIVARLKKLGYHFVTVSQLAGAKNRDSFFPPLQGRERITALIDGVAFALTAGTGRFLAGIFLFSLVAGAIRTVLTGILALRQARQLPPAATASFAPSVSVVIAAFNEEKVIARTIHALLAGNYPHLEVIVVDDGSKDDTVGVVQREFADEPRVRLVTQTNSGKAVALNRGIGHSVGDILIGLDADTLFAPDTVQQMVRHFADLTVGAVAGNIRVGNRINLWTRLQAIEYTTSQNFDRRGFAVLNSVSVVPGCVGAWRRTAVESAGGYVTDTLAEDADLTLRVRKLGCRIVTENEALAFTEAPESRTELLKQRYRWSFGTLQVLWKHRDTFLNPRYGWFGMVVVPSLWLFSFVLPAFAPVADLGIVAAALTGRLPAVLAYFGAFLLLEILVALLAFSLDNADSGRRRDLWLLPVQRILWRYLLLWVLWKSLLSAFRGARTGWGKLDRTGKARISGGTPAKAE